MKYKIYVAGHNGMVGSAIVRNLLENFSSNSVITRTRAELDLCNQDAVQTFFKEEKPDVVYLAAATVGGIYANNTYPAEFIYQNIMIEANVIHAAFLNGVKKLLFLGSSCIYPKFAMQPISESALLTGALEPTNEPYAISKIAGIKLCESYNRQYGKSHGLDYRTIMPCNLYGPGDKYHVQNSHVIPSLINRFHRAKLTNAPKIDVWGTGMQRREFLYVDDVAAASIHVMQLPQAIYAKHTQAMQSHINVGSNHDITIAELAVMIAKVVGFTGEIQFDITKPDGTKRKLMKSTILNELGWYPKETLMTGLAKTYADFLENH